MSATRCPSCAAAVRPDDPWCTLCYADLRAPEPVHAPLENELALVPDTLPTYSLSVPAAPVIDEANPLGVPASGDDAPAGEAAEPAPRWTCPACGDTSTYDDLRCGTCERPLLADDAPAIPSLVRQGSPGSKAMVILGGMAALMTLIIGLFFVIGSFL